MHTYSPFYIFTRNQPLCEWNIYIKINTFVNKAVIFSSFFVLLLSMLKDVKNATIYFQCFHEVSFEVCFDFVILTLKSYFILICRQCKEVFPLVFEIGKATCTITCMISTHLAKRQVMAFVFESICPSQIHMITQMQSNNYIALLNIVFYTYLLYMYNHFCFVIKH